jgi:hypothetical protein
MQRLAGIIIIITGNSSSRSLNSSQVSPWLFRRAFFIAAVAFAGGRWWRLLPLE